MSPASRRRWRRSARRDPSLRVVDYPILFTTGLVFNVHKPPFDDVRVRRAISMSIDRSRSSMRRSRDSACRRPVPFRRRARSRSRGHRCTTSPVPTRSSTRQDGDAGPNGARRRGGRPFAFDLLTVGQRRQRARAAHTSRSRAARHSRRHSTGGARHVPHRRARAEQDVRRPRRRHSRRRLALVLVGDVRDAAAGRCARLRRLSHAELDSLFAAARTASDQSSRVAAWHAVQHLLADACPSPGSTTRAACRASRRVSAT